MYFCSINGGAKAIYHGSGKRSFDELKPSYTFISLFLFPSLSHPFPPEKSCVRLPDVLEAYEGTGTYTSSQRLVLMNHLENPEQRKHPWPAKLESAFGAEEPEEPAAPAIEAGDKIEAAPGIETPTVVNSSTTVVATCKNVEGADSSSGDVGADSGSSQLGGGMSGPGGAAAKGRSSRGGKGGRVGGGGGGGGIRGRRGGFGGKGRGAVGGMAAGVGGMVLLGSPMVDATLDDTHGLRAVIEVLKREMGHGGGTLKEEVRVLVSPLDPFTSFEGLGTYDFFVCIWKGEREMG